MLRLLSRWFSDDSAFRRYHRIVDADGIIRAVLKAEAEKGGTFVDVAGGDGTCLRGYLGSAADAALVTTIDNDTAFEGKPGYVMADVVRDDLALGEYDAVFCYNAMEHFCDPVAAARTLCALVRPGGVLVAHTVFAWRYHPVPKDYYRFTDDALRYLFGERNGLVEEVCGYDLGQRRDNIVGGFFGDRDVPPRDLFGGFRENWGILYVGRRPLA